jgi:hypothetical protein
MLQVQTMTRSPQETKGSPSELYMHEHRTFLFSRLHFQQMLADTFVQNSQAASKMNSADKINA